MVLTLTDRFTTCPAPRASTAPAIRSTHSQARSSTAVYRSLVKLTTFPSRMVRVPTPLLSQRLLSTSSRRVSPSLVPPETFNMEL